MDTPGADPEMTEFIDRCEIAYLIGIDDGGGPRADGIGGRPGFAALLDHGTLAMELPADRSESRFFVRDRVAVLMLDASNLRHLVVCGSWHEMNATVAAAALRCRLGIVGRGQRAGTIGIVDIAACRWTRIEAGGPAAHGISD
jgi:hypothetical protein